MLKQHDERRRENDLVEAIQTLACELKQFREQVRVDSETITALRRVEHKLETIMASQNELTNDLKAVLAQQQKTAAEIADVQAGVDTLNAKVVALEEVIAAGVAPSQELVDAVAAVKAQAQIIDELIPDLPVTQP